MQWADGVRHPFNIVSQTFRKNVEKAWDIVMTGDPAPAMRSPKTRAFVDNLSCLVSDEVTVDVWARRIAEGDLDLKAKGIGEKLYAQYAEAYREVARDVGRRPCEVQAITWVEARNRKRVRARGHQLRLL
jgi:hypothetical protein